jgi:hypothetical protein
LEAEIAEQRPRVKIVPHADGSLTICCGDHCVEVDAKAAPDDGDGVGGGLTPPDAALAPPDSLAILSDLKEGEREVQGLLPVDVLSADAFEELERVDKEELAGPKSLIDAQSIRVSFDMGEVGDLMNTNPRAVQPGRPLRLTLFGDHVELDRLSPFMEAAQKHGQDLEVHVLRHTEDPQ